MTTLVTTTATNYNKIRSANAVVAGAEYRGLFRSTDLGAVYSRALSATIEMPTKSVLGHTEMTTEKPRKTLRFTSDPILLTMSDDEYIAALEALSGSLPDDEVRDSIDEMNEIWRHRLGKIYDAVNDPDTHP